MKRFSVTILIIILILFSIGQGFTKFGMIKGFKSYYKVSGTLEGYKGNEKGSDQFNFKLKEYPTIFEIDYFVAGSFDKERFWQLYAGDKVTVSVEPSIRLANTAMTTPGQVSAFGKNFIDEKGRDSKWRSEGWLAVFLSFLFTAGLIHHIKRPWV